jgi:hypothetical protein
MLTQWYIPILVKVGQFLHILTDMHFVGSYIYRVYQNSTAKLQDRTPHIKRRKKVYDNMVLEMHNYRDIRPFSNVSAIRHSQHCCTVTLITPVTPAGTLWSRIRGNVQSDLLLPEYRSPLIVALSAAHDQKCPV